MCRQQSGDEVTVRGHGLPGASEVSQLSWLEIREPDQLILQPLKILVDRGEAEALALALTLSNCTVFIDDARARRVAERLNIKRIGTVGLLRQGKKAGLIERIEPLLKILQVKGIYINQKIIDAVLKDVGEK